MAPVGDWRFYDAMYAERYMDYLGVEGELLQIRVARRKISFKECENVFQIVRIKTISSTQLSLIGLTSL